MAAPVRQHKTELVDPPAPALLLTERSWLALLSSRIAALSAHHAHARDADAYGGAGGWGAEAAALEDAVDEARRMVCLARERRGSDGEGAEEAWSRDQEGERRGSI
ncbi:hypothetical protein Q5752_003134 [Cryptotrichosporon argae]